MGDVVEEIIAEPEESGYIQSFLLIAHVFIRSYGWYIILGLGGFYYLWKNKLQAYFNKEEREKSPEELEAWKIKEEQRLKAVLRLQQKYEEDAKIQAEKQKELEEKKRKARLAEVEALTKQSGGKRLGDSSSSSLRPEYNPLMGDAGSSDRVCFRRPGGGSSG